MPIRPIIGFLWEWIIGKDVRLGKAFKYHKLRIILFIFSIVMVFYSYHVTKRVVYHYNRYNIVKEQHYQTDLKLATAINELEEQEKTIRDLRQERKALTTALISCTVDNRKDK